MGLITTAKTDVKRFNVIFDLFVGLGIGASYLSGAILDELEDQTSGTYKFGFSLVLLCGVVTFTFKNANTIVLDNPDYYDTKTPVTTVGQGVGNPNVIIVPPSATPTKVEVQAVPQPQVAVTAVPVPQTFASPVSPPGATSVAGTVVDENGVVYPAAMGTSTNPVVK